MEEPDSPDAPNVERPSLADKDTYATTCYACGLPIDLQEQVTRMHEATMHRDCYERDIDRGR